MNETTLRSQLKEECRVVMPRSIVLVHQGTSYAKDRPDMTCTWSGPTSWWELKFYDNKPFKSYPTQEIMARRLAEQGVCYYVVYALRANWRTTHIVRPRDLDRWDTAPATTCVDGFNHTWVAEFIRQAHMNECRGHEHHRQDV